MDSAPELKKIGKYDVQAVLGRGGMGVVYKAVDSRIKRLVAIKMMTGDVAKDPDYLKRFYREAQSTGALQHPNIVVVYDLGDEEGNPYLVMEYLEGITLDKIISSRTQLSVYEKLSIMAQVLDGLAYAHQRGIVHRDIKPQNIMVLRDRSVKIVDFGIARMGSTGLTKTGQVIGTINYMSPEQINAAAVDGRSDVFAAAVVLFELMTYTLPFEGRDTTSTIMKILQDPAPLLKEKLTTAYPEQLDTVLRKALAKDRDERYQLASDFALELTHVRDRLKRDMVEDYLQRGRIAMERGELASARELLQQLVKVDGQHAMGKELLQQVQEKLMQQQRHDQARQLTVDAREAFEHQSYDDALALAEQALGLDKNNPELQKLRQTIQEAKFKKERLEASLRRAATAQQSGEFDEAQRAIEEALSIDPESSQAKLLKGTILKRMDEHVRARQLAELVDNARMNIQSRRFTVASDLLKQAEKIDPESLEVQVLLRETQEAHAEEAKRRQVESLTRQVEEALALGDQQTAWNKANEALQIVPADAHLLQLRRQAEQLRDAASQKQAAEQAIDQARQLLGAGKLNEALAVLEEAQKRFPADGRFQKLLATVRQTAEREQKEALKREALSQAKTALDSRDYAGAVAVLKAACEKLPGVPEIEQLLKYAEEEFANHAAPEGAQRQAERLAAAKEFAQAIAVLEEALRQRPDDQLQALLAQIRAQADADRREMGKMLGGAQQLTNAGKAQEALQMLEANLAKYGKVEVFQEILAQVRAVVSQQKPAAPAAAPVAPSAPGSATQMMSAPAVPVAPQQAPVVKPAAAAAPAAVAAAKPQAAKKEEAKPSPAPVVTPVAQPTVTPVETKKKEGGKGILIAAVIVLLLMVLGGVAGVFFFRNQLLAYKNQLFGPKKAVTTGTAYIEINAVPWGTVTSIASTDGTVTRALHEATPVRVDVPPGEYKIVVTGPNGQEQTQTINVTKDAPGNYQPVFGEVDVDQIISNSK